MMRWRTTALIAGILPICVLVSLSACKLSTVGEEGELAAPKKPLKKRAPIVKTPAPAPTPAPVSDPSGPLVEYRPFSFEKLVKASNPGVVNIYTRVVVRDRPGRLRQFMPHMPREKTGESLGTGFIIDPKGLVVTNHHVINNATQIQVRLWNDKAYDAKVVGTDPKTDIALLQIENPPSLHALPLGNSDGLAVGEWVLAIGNALGLRSTVTAGIVSALGRSEVPLGGEVTYVDFIQTDASINPGNSGGPLLNMKGEVVGINTAISREGRGIGFAIPIAMAKAILPQLEKNGKVTRSWLGIYVSEVTGQMATEAGLVGPLGAQVRRIVEGGPAEKAGLVKGDIIVSFNAEPVDDIGDLRWKSSVAGIGEKVKLKVRRGDGDVELVLVMARNPHD